MSEVLGSSCLVNFGMEDAWVNEGGAHAEGYISCDLADCRIRNLRPITGDVEAGLVIDLKVAAEAKVLRRARTQITNECAVWTSDPANIGQDIPNERLPQILQRHPQS